MTTETKDTTLAVNDGEDTEDTSVCFVCTGNTCRSPMAEACLKSRGYKNVISRGIAARDGDPISEFSALALEESGIASTPDNDYKSHRAQNITDGDMARADLVYCMTSSHARMLLFAFPQYAGKIHVMPDEISDPFGGNLETYKKTLAEISSAIAELFPAI